ncbi:MAG: Mini-ribonuclease 3 [Caulobacteraceae bacterium]
MSKEMVTNTYKEYLDRIRDEILCNKAIKPTDIKMMNPLVLAYVGDSVYETFVRTFLVTSGQAHVSKLHKMSVEFVKAKAQAEILAKISELLTEEEQDIVRRGRNTKSATVPKNADISDYRYATGFEALIGFLYLTGQLDRLIALVEAIVNIKLESV